MRLANGQTVVIRKDFDKLPDPTGVGRSSFMLQYAGRAGIVKESFKFEGVVRYQLDNGYWWEEGWLIMQEFANEED